MVAGYGTLHDRGVGHCVSVCDSQGTLIGGLYGLSLGRAFFGESMFSESPNTSKLALWVLATALAERDFLFIDCQQDTPHLRSLGATIVTRDEYLTQLEDALNHPGYIGSWNGWDTALAKLRGVR